MRFNGFAVGTKLLYVYLHGQPCTVTNLTVVFVNTYHQLFRIIHCYNYVMVALVIEDDAEISTVLSCAFRNEGFVVDVCSDGRSGLHRATERSYDLIVLDIGLPEMNGQEVCRTLRSRGVATPIIVLSVAGAVATKIELLALGADDYLTKPFSFEELLARARALLRRPQGIQGDVFYVENVVLDTATKRVTCSETLVHLTPKEFALLEYLMRKQGAAISRQELLEHVWDTNADPFTNTVETHIATLRRKLDSAEGKLIHTVSGAGYLIE